MPKRTKTKNPHEPKRRKTTARRTKPETAFPAPQQTPGQPRSREAFAEFEDHHESAEWWADYTHLRNEGFTWRIAAYIAWASSPLKRRWPATLKELSTKVLGLKSDKVIYKWRKLYPDIEQRVEEFRAKPLLRYRADVLYALVDVASTHDPSAHNDRKLFLEMSGDYKPRSALDMTGKFTVTDDDIDAEIERELAALAAGSEASDASAAGAAQQQPNG
jgi:hypothetical protein